MSDKFCFLNSERPCDLTCKAAFEVDDPVDNVDCYFIWLSHHLGEGLFEVRRLLEGMTGGFGGGQPFGGGIDRIAIRASVYLIAAGGSESILPKLPCGSTSVYRMFQCWPRRTSVP